MIGHYLVARYGSGDRENTMCRPIGSIFFRQIINYGSPLRWPAGI